jgi:hypothetical protein
MVCDSQLMLSMVTDWRERRPEGEQRADYPPWLCEQMSRDLAAMARQMARTGNQKSVGKAAGAAVHFARLAGLIDFGEP